MLLFLLAWAPIPVASVRLQPIGLLMLGAALLATLAVLRCRRDVPEALARVRSARWPIALLAAFAALVHLQLLPLPLALVELIAPARAQWHLAAQAALQPDAAPAAWLSLTIAPDQTLKMAQLSLVYLVCFVAVVVLVRTHAQMRALAWTLVASGVLQAVLGVVFFSAGMSFRFFGYLYDFRDVQGTFANRNHMAAYMVICLATGIGLMLSQFSGSANGEAARRWQERLATGLRFLLSGKMLLRLLLVVMVVALVLTRSRMGNASFFIAMLVAGMLALYAWRRLAPVTLALIVSLVVIDVLMIGSWIGLNRVVERMEQTALLKEDKRGEETFEERQVASVASTATVRDNWLTGTGAGTFEIAFKPQRTPDIRSRYNHMHNDYLEILSDTGVFGLALLGGVVLLSLRRAWSVLRTHGSNLARGMAFASLMSITAMAVHATVEFNLYIPAVALTFCVMLALAWAAHCLHQRPGHAAATP